MARPSVCIWWGDSVVSYIDDSASPSATDSTAEYLGPTSSLSFGLRFRDFVRACRIGFVDSPNMDSLAMNCTSPPVTRCRSSRESKVKVTLPPFPLAKRLFASQHAYFGTTFAFTNQQTFGNNLRDMYEQALDDDDEDQRLAHCHVLLILAFGQMYSINQWSSPDGPPGFEFFQEALTLLPDLHSPGSLAAVEIFSLVAWFFQNLNRRDTAFLYVSTCPS